MEKKKLQKSKSGNKIKLINKKSKSKKMYTIPDKSTGYTMF